MSLADHFRELRNRVIMAGLAILAGAVVGWIYYDPIINGAHPAAQGCRRPGR